MRSGFSLFLISNYSDNKDDTLLAPPRIKLLGFVISVFDGHYAFTVCFLFLEFVKMCSKSPPH